MSEDICGYEDTTSGEPCKNPAGSCPWHGNDDPPTRNTLLEEEPSITHLVAGELQNEATVPEACAEAGISVRQYHSWYGRGKDDDADEIFRGFRRECRRARMVAAGTDRQGVKNLARETDDARTLWKAHMQQYGDIYAEEGSEPSADTIINLPESITDEWQRKPNQ